MALLIDENFASNVSGWTVSAGSFSHVASEGSDFDSGYASIPASSTVYKTFSAVTSGLIRASWWWYDTGTTSVASAGTLVYLLPDSTVASTNSGAVITLERNSASTVTYILTYRNASGFQNCLFLPLRGQWNKIEVVLNVTARTYDLYVNDTLMLVGITSANASFTQIDRIAIVAQPTAPTTYFDNIQVESAYVEPTQITLIDHDFTASSGEIETLTPTTDARNPDPQKWRIPVLSGYGGFTCGANGAVPDASAACIALARATQDSVVEMQFKTSVSGVRYIGLVARFWDFPSATGAGSVAFRISSSDGNAIFSRPAEDGTFQAVYTSAVSLTANTVYTLKLVTKGIYYSVYYKQAAIDSGSYTLLTTYANNISARGLLAEEYIGPYILTTIGATDNYVQRVKVSGIVPAVEVATINGTKYEVDAGAIKHLARSSSGGGTQSIHVSRGIQFSHRSRSDGNYAFRKRTVVNGTYVKAYEQRTICQHELGAVGANRPFVTLLARGPWVMDNHYAEIAGSDNFTCDWDLDGALFSAGYRYIEATGSAVTGTNTGARDWTGDGTNGVLPKGVQKVTSFGSGQDLRISQVARAANTATATETFDISSKWEQTGDPNSHAINVSSANISADQELSVARAFLIQQGTSITFDATTLEQFRDDVKTPATLTMTTGTLKTDAAGDYNTDGFNERHGWHEITCGAGGAVLFTLPVASGKRFGPTFRFSSWSITSPIITIAGAVGVSGTDYLFDDLGDGTAVLQLLSDRTSDTSIQVSGATGYKNLMLLGVG